MERYEALTAEAFNFMKSRVIFTAAELDLFTALDDKPATAGEVARRLALDERALARTLDYLIALGLFYKEEGGVYHTTETGAFLSSRHPETILPMILHLVRLWESWSYLTETVREGSRRKREIDEINDESRAAFIGAMHVIGRDLSVDIADGYDLARFRRLLDVGGASGTYTTAFLKKNPEMRATIFDLEPVIPLARERMASEGLSDRVAYEAGDYLKDELPGGFDLALLSAVIHQNTTEENIRLYKNVFHALTPGGVILIRDHIMNETRTEPAEGALFALNMLVNTPGGDTYTLGEVKGSLEIAGFTRVRLARTGDKMDCLVDACKPV
jgi:SAM-dependent methyltransferase